MPRPARTFDVSSPDKVLYPDAGLTKQDVVDYYTRVADVMLPHVTGRIVTMRRFPDGIEGMSFYQKAVPDYFPDWITTVEVRKEGGHLREVVIDRPEAMAYLAAQASLEIHTWLSRADRPDRPDRLIIDLDPATDDFSLVRDAARAVRAVLRETGLESRVMTTGSRGLHVVVTLDRSADFDAVRAFAAGVAGVVAARDPRRFTDEPRLRKRHGRVFVDYLRNAYAQHGIAPYSLRARPGAPVATPLDWDELGTRRLDARRYTVANLFRRLAQRADPWAHPDRAAVPIGPAAARLAELRRETRT